MWKLCVPTYKRKNPKILSMLDKDEELEIYFFVRPEEDDVGFYNDLKSNDRIHIIRIPYGITELGLTRKAIVDHCIDNNIEYCCMFDDCIDNVVDMTNPSLSISEVFDKSIELLEHDKLSKYISIFTFTKLAYYDKTGQLIKKYNHRIKDNEQYFVTYAGQAIIINIPLIKKYGINYRSMKDIGFEDACFLGENCKAGLICLGRKYIGIEGDIPNSNKEGGSSAIISNRALHYYEKNLKVLKFLHMYGIYLVESYEPYCGRCSFISWDFNYLRNVLCVYRQQNSVVINKHLEIVDVKNYH